MAANTAYVGTSEMPAVRGFVVVQNVADLTLRAVGMWSL